MTSAAIAYSIIETTARHHRVRGFSREAWTELALAIHHLPPQEQIDAIRRALTGKCTRSPHA